MPTGYTSDVKDGNVNQLKEYMLRCARQFGALVHMREDDSSEIKYRGVSDYHLIQLNESYDKLKQLEDMTDEEIQKEIDESYEDMIRTRNRMSERNRKTKERYLNMIDKVEQWISPTENHLNLKEFALKQLKDSLEFDCNDSYEKLEIKKETISEYKNEHIKYYLNKIKNHSDLYLKEIKAVEDANNWISDLINSFD